MTESRLTFEGRQLKVNSAEDAKEITDAIASHNDLRSLTLSGNTLGTEACTAIAKVLSEKSNLPLELVNFSDIFTSRLHSEIKLSVAVLASALAPMSHLREVNFSDNAFGPVGAESVSTLIANNPHIKVLRLNNNGLGSGGGKIIAAALLRAHKKCVQDGTQLGLQVFVAGRNRLEDEGAAALAKAFRKIKTLVSIAMPQNGIRHKGIRVLARAFRHNHKLESIDLNDNIFTGKGAAAMGRALSVLRHLKRINFGDCLLRDKGGVLIANSLVSRHENLEELDLSYNEMRGESVKAIIPVLENKPALKHFNISGNEMKRDGIKSIKEALEAKNLSHAYFEEDEDEDQEEDHDEEDEDEDEDEQEEESEEEASGEDVSSDEEFEELANSLSTLQVASK